MFVLLALQDDSSADRRRAGRRRHAPARGRDQPPPARAVSKSCRPGRSGGCREAGDGTSWGQTGASGTGRVERPGGAACPGRGRRLGCRAGLGPDGRGAARGQRRGATGGRRGGCLHRDGGGGRLRDRRPRPGPLGGLVPPPQLRLLGVARRRRAPGCGNPPRYDPRPQTDRAGAGDGTGDVSRPFGRDERCGADRHRQQRLERRRRRVGDRGPAGGAPRRPRRARARCHHQPAQRRGEGEPVLRPGLQHRPRHRPRAVGGRHAGQPPHERPRPGLRRPQLRRSRARGRHPVQEGHLLRGGRRFLRRRCHPHELPQRAGAAHREGRGRRVRVRPGAAGRVASDRQRQSARRARARHERRAVGSAGRLPEDQRRRAVQPGHGAERAQRDGPLLRREVELDRPGPAARHRERRDLPFREHRPHRRRPLAPLTR